MTRGVWRGWSAAWLLAVYVFLAVLVNAHLWAHPGTWIGSENVPDNQVFMWFLAWTPHALLHGHDPFLTQTLNAGIGINLAWNTPATVLGVLLAPITLTLGPIFSLTVALTLALALSAWSLAMVLGRLPFGPELDRVPTAVAGLVFGFSPAILAAGSGHLNFCFLALTPVIIWLALRVVAGGGRPRRDGVLLGLACGVQLMIGEEVLVMTVIAGGGVVAYLAHRHRDLARRRWRGVLVAAAWAAGSGLLVGSWILIDQFRGPQQIKGAVYDPSIFHTDLDGLTTLTPRQAFAPAGAEHDLARFFTSDSEPTGFLGWPMLLALVAALVLVRSRPMRIAIGSAVVIVVFSLGGVLTIDNKPGHYRLPWLLAQDLPFLEDLLPMRWALLVPLFLGAAAAFALQGRTGQLGYAAYAVLVAALLPWLPTPLPAVPAHTPAFFADGAPGITRGSGLLVLPYPSPRQPQGQAWQAVAGLPFTMPGGYFIGPFDASGRGGPGGGQLPSSALFTDVSEQGVINLTDDRRRQLAIDLYRWKTSAIALGPAPHRDLQLQLVTTLLGRGPDQTVGDVDIWHHVQPTDVLPRG